MAAVNGIVSGLADFVPCDTPRRALDRLLRSRKDQPGGDCDQLRQIFVNYRSLSEERMRANCDQKEQFTLPSRHSRFRGNDGLMLFGFTATLR
jgi:hypothetical protein